MSNEKVYPVIEDSTRKGDDWVHKCGTTLLSAKVIHSIHDGPFALSGSGSTSVEMVPYCPNCQEKPSQIGTPLRRDPVDVSEAAILRRMREEANRT